MGCLTSQQYAIAYLRVGEGVECREWRLPGLFAGEIYRCNARFFTSTVIKVINFPNRGKSLSRNDPVDLYCSG